MPNLESCQISLPAATKNLLRALSLLLIPVLLLTGCGASDTFQSNLDKIVAPYSFSISRWEISALSQEVDELFSDLNVSADDAQIVVRYFAVMSDINAQESAIEAITSGVMAGDASAYQAALAQLQAERDALAASAEAVLEAQLSLTLKSLGIKNPLDSLTDLDITFPPVKLRLQEPPKLLVVSPRSVIGRIDTITLSNEMSLDDITALEDAVSTLDVSALIVDLGGIATYPSFVANRYGLQFALSTAVEEWFHQYLFFDPWVSATGWRRWVSRFRTISSP